MSSTGTPVPVSGRPRDPLIDRAVLTATLEILDRSGYSSLSLEEVARLAGTTRPTIYRRWPGRPSVVLAALATRLDVPAPPDTGCTLCDVDESFNVFLAAHRSIRADVLGPLYADCAADPRLRENYMATLIEPPRQAVGVALNRAIRRGDLREDIDVDQLLDMIGSLVFYRAMFGDRHLTDGEAEQAIETLLRGAAVDYRALLARSEALEAEHTDFHHHAVTASTTHGEKI